MKKIELKNKKRLLILIISIIVLIVLFVIYVKIINKHRNARIFALETEKLAEEVDNPVFKIDKIIVYSDANVEDLSENQNLSNINVSQFTDFAVYINNFAKSKKLSEENTINKIYIDNIGIEGFDEIGIKKFSTKSVDDLGKYIPIGEDTNRIEYEVVHKNSDKEKVDNSKSFYTDCQEPLIISYVNQDIVQNFNASNSGEKLALDGSILRYLNIDLEKLNYKISFTINIENNLGEKFACKCKLNIDLSSGEGEGIYSGFIMQSFDLSNGDYRFKKIS